MLEVRACKTVTRVSVPFTEGHYCGVGERPNTDWLIIAPYLQAARQEKTQMNSIVNNKDDNSNFRYLCRSKELPPGKSRQFSISNEKGTKIEIAVFNIDGIYYAISNTCQHQGGPLSEGILDNEKKIVTCPWHGWKYSVLDGKAPHREETASTPTRLG